MSPVFPGNARSLHFTGETKAFDRAAEEQTPSSERLGALGKPRERRPPPPRRIDPPARISEPRRPAPAGPLVPTPVESHHPYFGSLGPALRHKPEEVDDHTQEGFYDNPTMAMSRDALGVLPGAPALPAPKMPRAGTPIAIPHFRAGSVATPVKPPPLPVLLRSAVKTVRTTRPSRAPLALWIVAAMVVGAISFRFAPEVVGRIEPRAVGLQR